MSDHPKTCFVCEAGEYKVVVEDFRLLLKNGRKISVPDVEIMRCQECGEEVLSPSASKKVEGFVRKNGGYD